MTLNRPCTIPGSVASNICLGYNCVYLYVRQREMLVLPCRKYHRGLVLESVGRLHSQTERTGLVNASVRSLKVAGGRCRKGEA